MSWIYRSLVVIGVVWASHISAAEVSADRGTIIQEPVHKNLVVHAISSSGDMQKTIVTLHKGFCPGSCPGGPIVIPQPHPHPTKCTNDTDCGTGGECVGGSCGSGGCPGCGSCPGCGGESLKLVLDLKDAADASLFSMFLAASSGGQRVSLASKSGKVNGVTLTASPWCSGGCGVSVAPGTR